MVNRLLLTWYCRHGHCAISNLSLISSRGGNTPSLGTIGESTMNSNEIYLAGLYNDFSHLGEIENLSYKVDSNGTQFLQIKHQDGFFIDIIVPDGIFEWFIDFFDSQRNKLVSDWGDCYSKPIDDLKAERQSAVEELINDVLNHKLRFQFDKKLFRQISTVEIFRNNCWTKLLSNSKFTLW